MVASPQPAPDGCWFNNKASKWLLSSCNFRPLTPTKLTHSRRSDIPQCGWCKSGNVSVPTPGLRRSGDGGVKSPNQIPSPRNVTPPWHSSHVQSLSRPACRSILYRIMVPDAATPFSRFWKSGVKVAYTSRRWLTVAGPPGSVCSGAECKWAASFRLRGRQTPQPAEQKGTMQPRYGDDTSFHLFSDNKLSVSAVSRQRLGCDDVFPIQQCCQWWRRWRRWTHSYFSLGLWEVKLIRLRSFRSGVRPQNCSPQWRWRRLGFWSNEIRDRQIGKRCSWGLRVRAVVPGCLF